MRPISKSFIHLWVSFFRSKENVVRAVNLYITNRCERHMSAAFARIQWLHFVAEHFDILCTWTPTNSTTLLALLQKMQQWLLLALHNLILAKVQKLLGDQEVTVATHWFVMMGGKSSCPGNAYLSAISVSMVEALRISLARREWYPVV